MGLKRDILDGGFIDHNDLVSTSNTGGTDNGVMYSGEFVMLLHLLGELSESMKGWWKHSMSKVEISPGCVKRSPTNDRDDQGPDDYHGYLCGAKVCDPARAKAFLYHGVKDWAPTLLVWMTISLGFLPTATGAALGFLAAIIAGVLTQTLGYYDANNSLTERDFMWRFPQLITHAWFATGWIVPTPLRFFFIASLLFHVYRDVPTSDQDARRLGWLLIKNWDGKGIVSKWAVKKWNEKLLREYPNGMKDVASGYYGPEFPFTTYIPRT